MTRNLRDSVEIEFNVHLFARNADQRDRAALFSVEIYRSRFISSVISETLYQTLKSLRNIRALRFDCEITFYNTGFSNLYVSFF